MGAAGARAARSGNRREIASGGTALPAATASLTASSYCCKSFPWHPYRNTKDRHARFENAGANRVHIVRRRQPFALAGDSFRAILGRHLPQFFWPQPAPPAVLPPSAISSTSSSRSTNGCAMSASAAIAARRLRWFRASVLRRHPIRDHVIDRARFDRRGSPDLGVDRLLPQCAVALRVWRRALPGHGGHGGGATSGVVGATVRPWLLRR